MGLLLLAVMLPILEAGNVSSVNSLAPHQVSTGVYVAGTYGGTGHYGPDGGNGGRQNPQLPVAEQAERRQGGDRQIYQALETFYAVNDRYPTNDEGLQILATKSDKFPDGLLNKCPRDPWGNPYQYNNPGKHGAYDVICYGADGREGGNGGDQDICNDNDVKDKNK